LHSLPPSANLQRMLSLKELIALARGEGEVDLLFEDARVVDVFSGRLLRTDVAVARGMVVGFGKYRAKRKVDLKGRFLSPAFIDAHVHIESSMVTPREYARAVIPHGVMTVVCDFHEIANCLGQEGIRLMMDDIKGVPFNLYVMLPSCVPATPLETSGAALGAEDLRALKGEDWVRGLGEMMNFPGVLEGKVEVLEKLELFMGERIDGHAPGLRGKDLSAYIAAGIRSDHESISKEEAEEKVSKGMYVMIREGSAAKNLEELIRAVNPANSRRFMFASDDRNPADLTQEGSIDFCARRAIGKGIDPILAIQMATLNPAEYFGLKGLGAIAPGYRANLLVMDDLKEVRISQVYKDGRLVAEGGRVLEGTIEMRRWPPQGAMRVGSLEPQRFRIKAEGERIRLIEVIPGQIWTRKRSERAKVEGGFAVADPERDILKMAVVERHRGTGRIGLGFVRGFGMKKGAIASSVAHDSHNIVVVGVGDEEMARAVREVAEMGGGMVVVEGKEVLASLPLPIGGIVSDRPITEVRKSLERLQDAARTVGCRLPEPFMTLSFLALPVIPELKLTDQGLVDVEAFSFVGLFE